MSFIFGDMFLTVGALILCIFIAWVWGADKAAQELEIGSPLFKKFAPLWKILIKYLIPIVVFVILLGIFKISGV
jgi:NSS family neurotransmitter:Na+ symporter